ncbi:putative mRNA-capping enzyme subunit alpha [Blattamonas nauphoetae]|uniref:mRNA guanylyltransferase n=1 Tax=Blattamonas nauphoetae TaxID=2049346 RepID=A0ABQ9YK71_9EUKA|nr:putative mRNA-capping enzyme subunit alpha [Blattamonas nauphoetae]
MDTLGKFIQALSTGPKIPTEPIYRAIWTIFEEGPDKSGYPGNNPVSLDHRNIQRFDSLLYFVAEKTNGVRYLMFKPENSDQVFLLGRNDEVIQVNLKIPSKHTIHAPLTPERSGAVLIDGELILDFTNKDSKSETSPLVPTFYAFDMMITEGKSIADLPFDKRLYHLSLWIKQYNEVGKHNTPIIHPQNVLPIPKDMESFKVVMKKWHGFDKSERIWRERDELLHSTDGLIFTPVTLGYKLKFTFDDLLKWKPPELNTVDFLAETVFSVVVQSNQDISTTTEHEKLSLWSLSTMNTALEFYDYVRVGTERPSAFADTVTEQSQAANEAGHSFDPSSLRNGSIVECTYDRSYTRPIIALQPDELRREFQFVDDKYFFFNSVLKFSDEVENESQGGWRILQVRTDKSKPNHIRVVKNIQESILHPVKIEDIMKYVKKQAELKLMNEQKKALPAPVPETARPDLRPTQLVVDHFAVKYVPRPLPPEIHPLCDGFEYPFPDGIPDLPSFPDLNTQFGHPGQHLRALRDPQAPAPPPQPKHFSQSTPTSTIHLPPPPLQQLPLFDPVRRTEPGLPAEPQTAVPMGIPQDDDEN